MSIWNDNANRFATRAPDRVTQLRNEGVQEAFGMLRNPKIPEARRAEAALTTLLLSVDHQARISGITLDVAWWTKPLSPECFETVEAV